jgi:hypothetical protein
LGGTDRLHPSVANAVRAGTSQEAGPPVLDSDPDSDPDSGSASAHRVLRPASCFLLPASCFLLPASCFLLPASCFLLPASLPLPAMLSGAMTPRLSPSRRFRCPVWDVMMSVVQAGEGPGPCRRYPLSCTLHISRGIIRPVAGMRSMSDRHDVRSDVPLLDRVGDKDIAGGG